MNQKQLERHLDSLWENYSTPDNHGYRDHIGERGFRDAVREALQLFDVPAPAKLKARPRAAGFNAAVAKSKAQPVAEAFNAAINFALDSIPDHHGAIDFLTLWREGAWDEIALEFPDFGKEK